MAKDGAGIFINNNFTVTFGENSNTEFINNSANHSGAAIFLTNLSNALFDMIKFINNKATNGTVYTEANSKVTFKATCKVTFSRNSATQYGAAIYSVDDSHVTFTENSSVKFTDNTAIIIIMAEL